jgi:hypothetical protein
MTVGMRIRFHLVFCHKKQADEKMIGVIAIMVGPLKMITRAYPICDPLKGEIYDGT